MYSYLIYFYYKSNISPDATISRATYLQGTLFLKTLNIDEKSLQEIVFLSWQIRLIEKQKKGTIECGHFKIVSLPHPCHIELLKCDKCVIKSDILSIADFSENVKLLTKLGRGVIILCNFLKVIR